MVARGFMVPGVKDHIRRPLETSDSSETVSVARFVKRGETACASPTLADKWGISTERRVRTRKKRDGEQAEDAGLTLASTWRARTTGLGTEWEPRRGVGAKSHKLNCNDKLCC